VWTRREELTIPVQVKGKLRGTVSVPADSTDAELESTARADTKVASYLADGVWRAIVVPGRLVNFVPARPAAGGGTTARPATADGPARAPGGGSDAEPAESTTPKGR